MKVIHCVLMTLQEVLSLDDSITIVGTLPDSLDSLVVVHEIGPCKVEVRPVAVFDGGVMRVV